MPSLAKVAGLEAVAGNERAPEARAAFEQASEQRPPGFPDLLAAFSRAARSREERHTEGETRSTLDQARPPNVERRDDAQRNREQKPDRQR